MKVVIVGFYICVWLWCAYDNDLWPLIPGSAPDHQWSHWSAVVTHRREQLSRVSAFLLFTPPTMDPLHRDTLNITQLNLMVLNHFYKQMLEGI